MGGQRKPVPRRHCLQCEPPESTGAPPPELAGKTCTATLGTDGPVCGRPAVTVDKHERPVCNAETWTNVAAHVAGRHGQTGGFSDTPSGPADPSIAQVAQQLPPENPPVAGGLTGDAVRVIVREELDNFSTEVLRIPATMGQKQTALHPVGLCDDGRCKPCRAQRSGEHNQARKILADELEAAIEHKGRGAVAEMILRDGSDALAEVLDDWKDAGRPEPSGESEADKQIQVVH